MWLIPVLPFVLVIVLVLVLEHGAVQPVVIPDT